MAASENNKVTLAGSGVLLHVLNTSGEPVPVQGNDDGAVTTTGGASGGAVDQGTGAAVGDSWSMRIADETASAFITPLVAGDDVLADLRVGGVAVSGANPVPTSNAAASQADGHSASIGATTDTDTAQTLIGRVKNLLLRIPAALVNGRFDTNIGSWLGSTAPTVGQKTATNSLPVVLASDSPPVAVGGTAAHNATASGDPVQVGGVSSAGKMHRLLTDVLGRLSLSSANLAGDLNTITRTVVSRGIQTEGQSYPLFALRQAGGATASYQSAANVYALANGTASGDAAIIVHNHITHVVGTQPMGFLISGYRSTATSTNQRLEIGMCSTPATSATSLQTVDRFGFYYEAGVLGVFAYSTIAGGYLFQVAQSSWDDPLNGSGRSGLTYTASTAILNTTVFEARQFYRGGTIWEFRINGIVVYTRNGLFTNPIVGVSARIPNGRPYAYQYNSGAATAATFNVNNLIGFRSSEQAPSGNQFTSDRTTARQFSTNSVELPVYALRVSSSAKSREWLGERIVFRATNQSHKVRVYVGRATDFAITGGTWEVPTANRGTLMEENKGTGTEMAWTPTYANLYKVLSDVIIPAANETKLFDIETFFVEGDQRVGIDGDGESFYLVITGEAEGGSNGTLSIYDLHGREVG